MIAYIVGMIAGAVVTIFPLIYLMNLDWCRASILAAQPQFDPARFEPASSLALASSVTTIGAVVLLLSAAMMAITGLRRLGRSKPQASRAGEDAAPKPAEAELETPAQSPQL